MFGWIKIEIKENQERCGKRIYFYIFFIKKFRWVEGQNLIKIWAYRVYWIFIEIFTHSPSINSLHYLVVEKREKEKSNMARIHQFFFFFGEKKTEITFCTIIIFAVLFLLYFTRFTCIKDNREKLILFLFTFLFNKIIEDKIQSFFLFYFFLLHSIQRF